MFLRLTTRHFLQYNTIICLVSSVFLTITTSTVAAESAGVLVGEQTPALEKFAAEELCGYLKKLHGIDASVNADAVAQSDIVFLIGSPVTNPAVATAIGEGAWPELSDQGIAILPCKVEGKPGLVIGGGSPQATMWAVYELVERWGVRYLLHGDVLPENVGKLELPAKQIVMEPVFRVRQWRVVNDFPSGPESWGMADYRKVLGQLAKLKFNRILVQFWPYQPFLHFECRGASQNSATLWYGYKYPITDDMPGRRLFDDRTEFWNPDLPLGASYEEFNAAAEELVRRLMDFAKSRGMYCTLTANLSDYPEEFKELPVDWEPVHQLCSKTVVPGKNTSPTDPIITELAQAVLRATVKTYPQTDRISLGMPEWRQWAGFYETAWKALDAKYGIEKVKSLAEVLAEAENRKDYGAERAVMEAKGDIVMLFFYDHLLRDLNTLADTPKPNMPVTYCAVAEELFPILPKIMPPGSETLNFVDYTPTRILNREGTLATLGGKELPATLIYTLHDDNVGIVPMLSTGSLHKLNVALRKHAWAGFSTRYWVVSDHDPCVAYLARASWDSEATPQSVYRDLVKNVCGEDCVEDMLEAFRQLEAVTVILETDCLGLSFCTPGMHMRFGYLGKSEQIKAGYRQSLAAVHRAREKTRPGGRQFLDYWIGRLQFGIGYFECLEAARDAFNLKNAADQAKKDGKIDEAKQNHATAVVQIRRAVELSRAMLEVYADVAQDQSDAGTIATVVEYVYRPLKAEMESWSKE